MRAIPDEAPNIVPDVEETLGTLTDVEEIPELIPVTEDTTEHASIVEVTPDVVPFARRTSKIVSVPSELPPLSCFGGTTIDLETSDGGVFTERKVLLCHYSGYFRGALAGGFSEATMGRLPIPSIDSDHFEIVVYLLHRGQLLEGSDSPWATLEDLWLFGDEYIIPALQNAAMNALQAKHETTNLVILTDLHPFMSTHCLDQLYESNLWIGSLTKCNFQISWNPDSWMVYLESF
ncbi:hypothetical protein D6D24_04621 [Aureobasidium pullulans]|uniref:BTB domain-containing protein n=1 Tax=Aureobasidium pullulans TaxID=5580 RepID=A0A4S8VZI3_AURPU|nr:hypothetical protein D6D24_04621 [Aureobasidium pullulans]